MVQSLTFESRSIHALALLKPETGFAPAVVENKQSFTFHLGSALTMRSAGSERGTACGRPVLYAAAGTSTVRKSSSIHRRRAWAISLLRCPVKLAAETAARTDSPSGPHSPRW